MRSYFIPAITIYFISFVFEGPLRYFLNNIGLPYILYLRDFIPFIFIIYSILFKRNSAFILFTAWYLSVFFFIGLLYSGNIYQAGFGIKLFVPFFLGLIIHNDFINNVNRMKSTILFLLLISIAGVYLNTFIKFPWEGLQYYIGGINIEGTRAWITAGEFALKRIAGFSRSSSDAAFQILLLSLFIISYFKKTSIKIIIWSLAGAAIAITTSKGVAFAYILITFYHFMRVFARQKTKMLILVPSLAAMVGLPLYAVTQVSSIRLPSNPYLYFTFHSLLDRMVRAWPESFALIAKHGSVIFGRGIGGIGAAQKFFETSRYLPSDNLFIYLYGIFGLSAIVILLYTIVKSRNLNIISNSSDKFAFMILLYVVAHGFTAAIIEPGFVSFFAGFMMYHLYKAKPGKIIIRHMRIRDKYVATRNYYE